MSDDGRFAPLKPDVFHLLLALDEEGPAHGYALLERVARERGFARLARSAKPEVCA